MAYIPTSNPLKASPESSQTVTKSTQVATIPPKKAPIPLTEEEAFAFKGAIPKALRKQVVAIHEKRRQEKKERKRIIRREENAIVETRKIDAFFEEFLKNNGNATKAAMKAFNVTSYSSAGTLGSLYLKKCRDLGRIYMEEQGKPWGYWLEVAAEKAVASKNAEFFDRIMGLMGYENPGANAKTVQGNVNVNIRQTEREFFKQYAMDVVQGEEVQEEEEENDS